MCSRVDKRVAHQGKWLVFSYVDYQIGSRVIKNYEMIERPTFKNELGVGGVDIFALIHSK